MNLRDQATPDSIDVDRDGDDAFAASAPWSSGAARPSVASRLAQVGSRIVYWLPVFAAMTLFAQMSLCGLRPALCERRRLADADVTLAEREHAALALHATIAPQLKAREDPIFRERQRRLRQAELLARPAAIAPRDLLAHH